MDEITVMGIRIRRLPESSGCKPECIYHERGFCKICTCDKCEGGFLISEWREAMKQGCMTGGPRECECVELARNQKRLRDSGLEQLAARCTFDSYMDKYQWQKAIKRKAQDYLIEYKEKSFFISGQSGSGKTHICTAICNEIIRNGGRLMYFQWVKDGTRLKQLISEPEQYEERIGNLVEMPFLYMDDLFKQEVSAADIRLVYEIINGRYNAGLPTILSSERSLAYLRRVRDGDGEAIAGRIFEMCGYGEYCIELSGADKNMRFEAI